MTKHAAFAGGVAAFALQLLFSCGGGTASSPSSNGGAGSGGASTGGASGSEAGTNAAGADAASAGTSGSLGEAGMTSTGGTAGAAGEGGEAGAAQSDAVFGFDEPYRPQFHFSAARGWLNDTNGVFFWNGLYHLMYQASPDTLQSDVKSWGHAVSTDLLHWQHLPTALDSDVNVPGSVWSGSTVVDQNNTSGLATGANPVIVSIYTATALGTSVAYSNDLGATWQAYASNPINVGTADANFNRDPHVFWHAPSSHWVLVLYQNQTAPETGMLIFTSTDLLHWKQVSALPQFGHECPDFYELPIDGGKQTKWVLSDASGAYLLGDFDGTAFTPDTGTVGHLDQSSDYYAAQSFFRATFPDQRVVSMAWMRGDAFATAPFNQSLSFPTEVRLRTFAEGVRATRSPIAEITKLYSANAQHVENRSVPANTNALSGIASTKLDLQLTFDAALTKAKQLSFELGNESFSIDLGQHQIHGNNQPVNDAFSVSAGKFSVRILRDWGEYAVFINDGEVAYTRAFNFAPNDTNLSLRGDDTITLSSLDFHELTRIWAGKVAASSRVIDESDARTVFAGTWFTANEDRYFGRSSKYSRTQGDSFRVSFVGTRFEWWGLLNNDLGKADVYVDDELQPPEIDLYSARRQNALLYAKHGLKNGAHTFRAVVSGNKNPASAGIALLTDYLIAYIDQ